MPRPTLPCQKPADFADETNHGRKPRRVKAAPWPQSELPPEYTGDEILGDASYSAAQKGNGMARAIHRFQSGTDVLALQMDALYKAAPASVLTIFGGLIAISAYWSPQAKTGLLIWFFCICAPAAAYAIGAIARRSGRPKGWGPVAWSHVSKAIFLISGLAWGIGGAWMLSIGDHSQTLVICCVVMGAITCTFPNVVYEPAHFLFQVPILAIFTITLAASDVEFGGLLAIAAALLCIALVVMARAVGSQLTLALHLSLENKQLAEDLAERGIALERANRQLSVEALTDPLTGMANRRQLMNFMRTNAGRTALLIADIDHFKSYNDSFGHVDGDICLVLVAGALQNAIRPGKDLAARLGGEEFAVILSDLSQDEAIAVADRIRSNVQTLIDGHPRQIRRPVTISIGLAYRSSERDKTHADLMEEADTALYQAKNSGRNRVSAHASPSGDLPGAAPARA